MTTGMRLDDFVPAENISASFDGNLFFVSTETGSFEIGKIHWNAEVEIGFGLNELAVSAWIVGKF